MPSSSFSHSIQVCHGRSCMGRFSPYIMRRLASDLSRTEASVAADIQLETCLCQWFCKEWPVIIVDGERFIYQDPVKAAERLKQIVLSIRAKLAKKI